MEVVRHLVGVQAQVLPAAGLALRARTEGLTGGDVDRARLHDRSIVLTWAMRGTLHLVARDDYAWMVPLVVEPRIANARRRLAQEGVSGGEPERGLRLIARMLERDGPLTRREIADRLARDGIRAEGQAIAHLLWLASAEGVMCHGPDRGADRTFVRVRDWIDARERLERGRALEELAVRYLAAHGPSEPTDLAFWSGIRVSDAARAWRRIEDRLDDVETAHGRRWMLRSGAAMSPPGLVRLLPAFDEYLLGWKDRALAVAPRHRARINRGGGWLHATIVVDGRVVGTWRSVRTRTGVRLEVEPFSPLATSIVRRVSLEGADVGRFVGSPVEDVRCGTAPEAGSRRRRPRRT